jgi:type IV pilus assembly protein PilP
MKTYWFLSGFFSCLLMACNSSADLSLDDYLRRVRSRAMQQPKPIPQLERLAKFLYPVADTRPNPFQVKTMKLIHNKKVGNQTRIKQFLEEFPLKSLRFVGVMKKDSETWALISRREGGELSTVKVGDFMGENEGRIIEIKENSLRLGERIYVAGQWTKEIKEIFLNSTAIGHNSKVK